LLNENSFFNGVPETLEENLKAIDELGGPKHFNHFPAGWAHAMNTPFQWTKQIASHLGGVRNPLAVSWPARIKDRGGVRDQFHHVVDLAPTLLEACGITFPTMLNGVAQKPIEGVSMLYAFDSAEAPGRRRSQYFEMFINRAIYSDGWWAASRTGIPWDTTSKPVDPDTAAWELYHLDEDFSQASNLAAKHPEKLRELQEEWWAAASRYNVLPLDGRKTERLSAELQGRPSLSGNRTLFTYYPGTLAVPAGSAPKILNKSFVVTANIETDGNGPADGAIFSIGGSDGGYGLYVRNGSPVFAGNFLNRSITRVTSPDPLPAGPVTVRAEFDYDGGGLGKGGELSLYVNDQKVGQERMEQTQSTTLGLGGTLDVGADTGTPVDDVYAPPFRFGGKIKQVTVELKP
jgi:arylsulfatase